VSEVPIPGPELVEIGLLKTDGRNPNFMSKSKLAALEESIKRWGFAIPIITNKDLLVADGEQRLSIAKKLGMPKVPVVRLPVGEVDRRLIRQVMNKLKGEHIESRDAEEFKFILEQSEKGRQDLSKLLVLRDRQIDLALNKSSDGRPSKNARSKAPESETAVKCPKCQYVFQPGQHKAIDFLSKVEFEKLPFQNIPADSLNKDFNVLVNVAFETTPPEVSERVVAVAHSFGLGIDETRTFPVFSNFVFRFSKGDLTYITGDSGSGKTVLLAKLREYCLEQKLTVAYLSEESPREDERVVESLGASISDAMSLLSTVGLSEAFIMLAEYKHLSDGQRYRYRLAKLFARRTDIIFIDEFCATLDREMAKVISYNLQRHLRKTGQTAFVASTHKDVVEDLDPDILVLKLFGDSVNLCYADPARQPRQFSLTSHMHIESCISKDVKELLKFHYLSSEAAACARVFRMTLNGELVGCIIYNTISSLDSGIRAKFFPEYRDIKNLEGTQIVNDEVRRISRVVINPKYRGVGLAEKLVRDTLPLAGAKLVETVAAMAKYNPFFERAGMRLLGILNINKDQLELKIRIKELGGNPDLMYSSREAKRFYSTLTPEQKQELTKLVFKIAGHRFASQTQYGKTHLMQILRAGTEDGVAALLKLVLLTEKYYLAWERPD